MSTWAEQDSKAPGALADALITQSTRRNQ